MAGLGVWTTFVFLGVNFQRNLADFYLWAKKTEHLLFLGIGRY